MEVTLALGLLWLLLAKDIYGLQTDCACYGNDVTVDSLMPNCTSFDGFISIDSVYRAAKLQSAGCANPVDSTTRDETNCCTYDSVSDCRINLTSSDVPDVFSDCSGAASCSKQVTWQSTPSHCDNTYMSQTNYMCMEYDCIPSTDALEFCDTSGSQVISTTLYFHNDGYPSTISHYNCCACVITPSAASATINLDILDIQLYDQTSTCMQTVFITDNTGVTSYNCTENNGYNVRNLLSSSGGSLTVTLKSEAPANGNGKALFRASVSNGELTTTCGPVAACPDEVTITLSSTDGTTTADKSPGTGSTSDTTKETWLFGLSRDVSIVIISGIFLTIVLLFLLFCVICYKFGKSKSFSVTRERIKSSRHLCGDRRTNLPTYLLSYTKSSKTRTTKTEIKSVRSVDLELSRKSNSSTAATRVPPRTNMLVHGPFENRTSLTSNNRRQRLVKVENP